MRFLLITAYWKNSHGGGVRVYSENLVNELKNFGIPVDVIFEEGYDPEEIQFPRTKFLFNFFSIRKIKKNKPNIIFTSANWRCLLRGILLKTLFKGKLFCIFHSTPEKLPRFIEICLGILTNQSDKVIFVSKYLMKNYIDLYKIKRNKINVIYPGVKVRKVTESDVYSFKQKYGIKDNKKILLAQGLTSTLNKANGLKLIIESLHEIKKVYSDVYLIATGSGSFNEELNELVNKENLSENVILTGNVENPFIPLYLCDIFTHVVYKEAISLAVLEAMSMGKPIIATNIGGIPEIIYNGKNGILISPDKKEIIEKISYLFENKTIAETMGYNAKLFSNKFTWNKVVEEIINLY